MRIPLIFAALFAIQQYGFSQSLRVEVSTDSLLFGNPLKVTFIAEGTSTDGFEAPDFEGFSVVNGPAFSSSVSIVNGAVSQRASVSYWLEPEEVGVFFIPPAFLVLDSGETLESQPLEILVVPNPDGIQQIPEAEQEGWLNRGFSFDFDDFFSPFRPNPREPEQKKKEKERKVYKF